MTITVRKNKQTLILFHHDLLVCICVLQTDNKKHKAYNHKKTTKIIYICAYGLCYCKGETFFNSIARVEKITIKQVATTAETNVITNTLSVSAGMKFNPVHMEKTITKIKTCEQAI